MARSTINDSERRDYVDNDEGLLALQQSSGIGLWRWVRENRDIIDEVINNVNSGRARASYLAYGEIPQQCRTLY